ncbi:MAG: hypothetical protein ACI33P_03915 [Lysinibacillus sp.]
MYNEEGDCPFVGHPLFLMPSFCKKVRKDGRTRVLALATGVYFRWSGELPKQLEEMAACRLY